MEDRSTFAAYAKAQLQLVARSLSCSFDSQLSQQLLELGDRLASYSKDSSGELVKENSPIKALAFTLSETGYVSPRRRLQEDGEWTIEQWKADDAMEPTELHPSVGGGSPFNDTESYCLVDDLGDATPKGEAEGC
ncbi:unnamed protein product [Symbiodinium sp. CCMP2456]|nr:unnamed protein product [Symbiodinium sp. CCMP2456]